VPYILVISMVVSTSLYEPS